MAKLLEVQRLPRYSSTVAASLSPVLSQDRQVEIGYRKKKGIEISLDTLKFPLVLLTLLRQPNDTARNTVLKRTQFPHLNLPAREQSSRQKSGEHPLSNSRVGQQPRAVGRAAL